MRRYRYLLLDLDNTLLDFDRAEETAFFAAFSASGLVADAAVYRRYSEINDGLWKRLERGELRRERLKDLRFELLFAACGLGDAAASRVVSADYFRFLGAQSFTLPGAETVCRALSAEYELHIITNGTAVIQHSRLAGCGLLPYFSGVYISEEVGAAKPSNAYFTHVLRALGAPDGRGCCVVGDSLTSDIDGANAAGLDAVWLDRRGTGDAQGRRTVAVLRDIRELPAFLRAAQENEN